MHKITVFALTAALLFGGTTAIAGGKGTALPLPATDLDFYDAGAPSAVKVELGRNLFFDKLLSGNLKISCATCHHALTDTGDGLSLPVGEGGRGLGVTRDNGEGLDAVHERVPRNAPPVFNLGAREFKRLFHDGRVEVDGAGFRSPAGIDLPAGLENVLAVQAMFPVTSSAEMAGQAGENPQANAAAGGHLPDVWAEIEFKLQDPLNNYIALFEQAYPGEITAAADISYVHAANAIAAFEAKLWRFDNSPFDQYLRGNRQALSAEARIGLNVFYGKGGCSDCHAGTFQSDHDFHAIAMPQIGPGKGDGDGHEDFGRERVTMNEEDRFRFRTPSLRNVALTAPYGHSGAYDTLEAMVRHHLTAVDSLESYDPAQTRLPSRPDLDSLDYIVMSDTELVRDIGDANELNPIKLKQKDFEALMAFLNALTDPAAIDLRNDVPDSVPSGLPVYD